MTYVTVKQHRLPKQINWEDILFGSVDKFDFANQKSFCTGTVTRVFDVVPDKILQSVDVEKMIRDLEQFNADNKTMFEKDRESLYRHFKIPKKTGGLRPIDAPCDELQAQLERLAKMLTDEFGILYHTAAFAYIKNRSIVDCVHKHQKNESNWFLKTDFSGFFPHTTLEYTMKMLAMVFPTSEICKTERGWKALERALSLGFLNNGLPQGTKLSPCLTNCIMIPIDHALFNALAHRKIIYTRYADDMHISAQEKFPYKEIVEVIRETLKQFGAPYELKDEKTHFGSRKGKNWMLGLMLNGENNITVGFRQKKYFKAMLNNFVLDTINNKPWDIVDVMSFRGTISYYMMVEPEYFKSVIGHMNEKWHVNVEKLFNQYLSA